VNTGPASSSRRAATYSALVAVPYIAFLLALLLDPAALGWVPIENSVVSLAIYVAAALFLWPIVVALLFLRRVERP
jgi:uncharacterized membrane protein (DUF485 family)